MENNIAMSVKLAILKSGETVISELKELVSEDNVCGYLFDNPHVVSTRKAVLLTEDSANDVSGDLEIIMSPWIVLSSDTKIPVRPDWIVTIVEPIDDLREMYEEKLNGKDNQSFVAE